MSRSRSSVALLAGVVSAAVGVGLLGAPAAYAEKPTGVTITDPRGDAPPAIDLVKADFQVTGKKITERVAVRDLQHTGRFRVENYELNSIWDRVDVVWRHGHPVSSLYLVDGDRHDEATPKRCPGLRTVWSNARGTITVTLPRSCSILDHTYAPYYFKAFSFRRAQHDQTVMRKAT